MKLFAEYYSKKNKEFHEVQLFYSALYFLGENKGNWFCRIWRKDYLQSRLYPFGESYGKNRFEAYRKALKDLNNKL